MTNDKAPISSNCGPLVRRSTKLVSLRETERITAHEFAFNFVTNLVSDDERCWRTCIDVVRPELLAEVCAFAKGFLEEVDFMPPPEIFLVGPWTDEEVEAKKRELRPRYASLYTLITERASSAPE